MRKKKDTMNHPPKNQRTRFSLKKQASCSNGHYLESLSRFLTEEDDAEEEEEEVEDGFDPMVIEKGVFILRW